MKASNLKLFLILLILGLAWGAVYWGFLAQR